MITTFHLRRANCCLRASSQASLQVALPAPMSPTCTTKSSRSSRFMSSISRSRRRTSAAEYGVSPSTPNTTADAGACAQPASRTKNRDSPHFSRNRKIGTVPVFLDAVGLAQEGERMRLYSAFRLGAHPLHDVARGDRAVGTHVFGLSGRHLAEHRAADLHAVLEVLAFHAPRAIVSGAPLDHRHLRAGHE